MKAPIFSKGRTSAICRRMTSDGEQLESRLLIPDDALGDAPNFGKRIPTEMEAATAREMIEV